MTEHYEPRDNPLRAIAVARRGECPDVMTDLDKLPAEIDQMWADLMAERNQTFEHIQTLRTALFGLLTASGADRDGAAGRAMAVLEESSAW